MDGGATDVPILGPMEGKNCISVLFFTSLPTRRLQNFLLIENRRYGHFCTGRSNFTHILWKQPSKIRFLFFFFNRPTDCKSFKSEKNIWFYNFILFCIFDRPTALERLEKNPPSIKSTERGLTFYNCVSVSQNLFTSAPWVAKVAFILCSHYFHVSQYLLKARVSWFLEWRIDRCNEKSSDGKIKMGTHFFFILASRPYLSDYWPHKNGSPIKMFRIALGKGFCYYWNNL